MLSIDLKRAVNFPTDFDSFNTTNVWTDQTWNITLEELINFVALRRPRYI